MTASPATTLGPSIELDIGGMTCAPPAVPRYGPRSNSAARGGPVADARLGGSLRRDRTSGALLTTVIRTRHHSQSEPLLLVRKERS